MALIKLPHVFSALQFGELSLQAATSENVFFQGPVYGRENWTDEYSMGIATLDGNIRPNRELAGYEIADITESGYLDELKNNKFVGVTPWPHMNKNATLFVERPQFMPADIDLQGNTTIQAQFTDLVTATHMMQYGVNIYIEYEELD